MSVKIGLIGAGDIARKHLDVIRDMKGIQAAGITSRTKTKAQKIAQEYKIPVCACDVDTLIKEANPDALMVLVSIDQIYKVCCDVIPLGLPLFIEKPAGLDPDETKELAELAGKYSVKTMVGYNRRYYSIFHKGIDIIRKNGDLMGVRVEGHERFWKLKDVLKDPVRSQWIYANNSHMIDLLRFFGGEPADVKTISKSRFEGHGDQFAAVMNLESGAIGHYNAHWYSPGGWGVTLFGEGATVEFKPLENGRWMDRQLKSYEIKPDDVDLKYKAGFYRQMEAFINMVRDGQMRWPAQSLEQTYHTMTLAQIIAGEGVHV